MWTVAPECFSVAVLVAVAVVVDARLRSSVFDFAFCFDAGDLYKQCIGEFAVHLKWINILWKFTAFLDNEIQNLNVINWEQ